MAHDFVESISKLKVKDIIDDRVHLNFVIEASREDELRSIIEEHDTLKDYKKDEIFGRDGTEMISGIIFIELP